ncbi:MAG: hypothetical protein WCX22_03275 [Methanoregula sp.]
MMTDIAAHRLIRDYDYQYLDRIREKFHEVFGNDCPLQDDMILQRYNLTNEGDLVMFLQ